VSAEGRGEGLTRRRFLLRSAGVGAGLLAAGPGAASADALARAGVLTERTAAAALPRTQTFRSRPDLRPPSIDVVHRATGTAPGYILLAPSSGPGQRGVMMIDDAGEVVWFQPTVPQTAMNLRVASYKGRPVLTWWEGKFKNGTGNGECVIVDGAYREIARFKASNGSPVDLHEFIVTAESTALVTSNEIRTMDVTSLGGKPRGQVMGGVVLELEIPTGRVLWEWHSLDHVALDESHIVKVGPRFDYFHINSIDVAPDGNLIVSARNTWAIYKVNRRTGAIMWRLGGKKSDFAMGKGTVFAWQHDARAHGSRLLTVFDDGAAPKVEPQSRALEIDLDLRRMRATLKRRFVHHPALLAKYTGSAQLLADGHMFVGWGSAPDFSEYAADGTVRFDAHLPHGGQTYRALRFPWAGHPADEPKIAVGRAAAGRTLYVSWNGATEVVSWQLQTGASPGSLQVAGTYPRNGFETALPLEQGIAYAAAVALDASGARLGSSAALAV
jgi:Arylsulfotransferase (ASST)